MTDKIQHTPTFVTEPPRWLAPALGLGLLAMAFLVTVPLEFREQASLAYFLLAGLIGLRFFRRSAVVRMMLFVLATFITARYFYWRTTHTLGWHGIASSFCAVSLYLAECHGMLVFLLGMFTNAHPIRRRSRPPTGAPETWPSVDVLVPSYNESEELLETTLIAATQMRYPTDRFTVYLCDDGGTEQRRNHPDPGISAGAHERHEQLQRLCARLGVTYLTRERNEHSKAGNLNAAMKQTHNDLILVLDADHIPAVDFLEQTVGYMQVDPKLFLVQTPHFFVNPDPFEKNHDVFGEIPGENEMFYQVIQPGLDYWNSAFFCGSAALLRREFLDQIGGISGTSITEDAETALKLHTLGYHSVYLDRPLISGLQPETYSSFIIQRVRWAQGMVQIFLLRNPLFIQGLTWYQRLNYFANTVFWFFGYARIVYLMAPVAFLVFGLKIYDANFSEFLAYALPYVAASMVVSDFLFGKVRWTFVSEVYELLQSFYSLPGIWRVFLNPRSPSFAVTPKGENISQDFVSELSTPFYAVYAITILALTAGVTRWALVPEDRSITLITMIWEVLNFLILQAAAGVLYERKQRRSSPRMPADLTGRVAFEDGSEGPANVANMSMGGALVKANLAETSALSKHAPVLLKVYDPAARVEQTVKCSVSSATRVKDDHYILGLRFLETDLEARRKIVSLNYGDSGRWLRFQERRQVHVGIFRSFLFLLSLGFQPSRGRITAFWRDLRSRMRRQPAAVTPKPKSRVALFPRLPRLQKRRGLP